ncbi:MAG: lipopolysaccharide assembly protein LapA domain-containing protein [Pirellulaceae bacterium]
MMQRIRWVLLILGISIFVILSVWNSGTVTVQFPFMSDRELSLSNLLLITSAGSFVFGSIMTGWMLRGARKAKAAKEKARLDETKAELAEAEKKQADNSTSPLGV